MKILLKRFNLNSNTIRFHLQTQKLVEYNKSYFNTQSWRQMVLGMNVFGLVHLWLICLFLVWCFRSWNSQCLYRGRHVRHSVTKKSKYMKEDLVSLLSKTTLRKSICVLLISISTARWLLSQSERNSLGFCIFSRKKVTNLNCDRKKIEDQKTQSSFWKK